MASHHLREQHVRVRMNKVSPKLLLFVVAFVFLLLQNVILLQQKRELEVKVERLEAELGNATAPGEAPAGNP